jgi:plasmid stability protein
MTLTIELPDEQTTLLTATARAQGLSAEQYARQVLEQAIKTTAPQPEAPPEKDIEELFAPLRGLNLDFSRNPSTGRPVDL